MMAVMPYTQKSMHHLTSDGVRFAENTDGIGDLDVMALCTV